VRLISGLPRCSDGQVIIAGKPTVGPETKVGIVFQTAVLLEWRTLASTIVRAD
jgi:ABC-type nitrate/sulfonate/bicarbonate transport system ATPase subunit